MAEEKKTEERKNKISDKLIVGIITGLTFVSGIFIWCNGYNAGYGLGSINGMMAGRQDALNNLAALGFPEKSGMVTEEKT